MSNEPLSQEELDALINAATEASALDDDPSGADIDPSMFGQDADAESHIDPSMLGDAGAAADMPFAGMTSDPSPSGSAGPAKAPLHMSSFDTPGASVYGGRPMQGFDRVQDIPLEITVELGRTRILIKDILELGTGSIIELEKMAGEPVNLLANGLLIARGEVVVIEDSFGVRVTEIITSAERKAITDDTSGSLAA